MTQLLQRILPTVQKPARYTGGEYNEIQKDKSQVRVRVAFCFPDTYEIGMSNVGMRILYGVMNQMDGVWCERVFAPWADMEEAMRQNSLPLWALESQDPVRDFDMIAFTVGYEMSYSNIVNMLNLAGIPLYAKDRQGLHNMVFAGGVCTFNPEPLADFVDFFSLGEGEESTPEIIALYDRAKAESWTKEQFLLEVAKIPGIYVPSFFNPEYNADSTLARMVATENVPATITKRIVENLDKAYWPTKMIVPSTEIVHDRANLEVFRGCIRGCRFCQAGFSCRPVRKKSPEVLYRQAVETLEDSGHNEITLSSLSTSDYRGLKELTDQMIPYCADTKVSLSVPSLRADNFSRELMEKLQTVRKSGLTFAPEAGTQRLRDVINKNLTEEEILTTCTNAFAGGWNNVKLYFMLGLPTETDEDVLGIAELVYKVTKPFALQVMQHMNDACKGWKMKHNIDFSLYGTPLESTTYKFAKCLQQRFGKIPGITDKSYITNSYHVHVAEEIDAFTKLRFESEFQQLSPGGAISYVEVPNMQQNIDAVLELMKFIYDNIMYAELNTKSDYCQCCGYDGEIAICEDDGKLVWTCPQCGNTDQSKMNVARRTCGYIGTQYWNQGRTQEIKDRVLHL